MKNSSFVHLFLASALTILPLTASPRAAEHIVRIVSDYENLRMIFEPKILIIQPGDTVSWVNEADEEHNVISYPDGYPRGAIPIQSPILTKAGERFSHMFSETGTYEYHCIPHLPMGMHGVIIVGQPSKNDEFHEPSTQEIRNYRDLIREWFDEEDLEILEREERASFPHVDAIRKVRQKT